MELCAVSGALLVAAACSPARREPARSEGPPVMSATPAEGGAPVPVDAAASTPPVEPAAPDAAAPPAAKAECPEVEPAPGFSECRAVELTGEEPCESICQRPRPAKATRCCEGPVEVVVLSGKRTLLRFDACTFVSPSCAHVHGHGNMDAHLRVLEGPPKELIFVEGGCEARALAHGYVPRGVAAFSGCVHQRYRWDGAQLSKVAR